MDVMKRTTTLIGAVGLLLAVAPSLYAQAIITNGTISLGVNAGGALNVACDPLVPGSSTNPRCLSAPGQGVGLMSNATLHDATIDGSMYVGWGVAVSGGAHDGVVDGQNKAFLPPGPAGSTTFNSTASTATSTVDVGSVLQVMQVFHPSGVADLYQIDVTLTNLTNATLGFGQDGILFRRVVDWNVEPTNNDAYSTIHGNGATDLLGTSDDGFASTNPFDARNTSGCDFFISTDADFYHSGPCDHGALFDFGFPALAAGASQTFSIFYGVANNEASALADLGDVHADDVYSLGQADCAGQGAGNIGDAPCVANEETFIMGFKGVGGATLGTPEPASLTLMATGMVAIGSVVRRRRKRTETL